MAVQRLLDGCGQKSPKKAKGDTGTPGNGIINAKNELNNVMKYIERELSDGQKTGWQLIKDMWNDTFGPKPPPKCTVADLVEHYEAYKKHIEQIRLMMRWIICHGDKHITAYHDKHPNKDFATCLRDIRYYSWNLNDYVDTFLDTCKKAGQT